MEKRYNITIDLLEKCKDSKLKTYRSEDGGL